MQNTEKIQISCPKCSFLNTFDVKTSINITNNPESKEVILNDDFFTYHCNKCNTGLVLNYPFLYRDNLNAYMLYYLPDADTKKIDEINHQLKTNDNINEELSTIYTLRFVEDLTSFKEKIHIFDNGKDDIAVELYKTLIMLSLKESHESFMPYDALYTNENKLLIIGENDKYMKLGIDEDIYDKLQNDILSVISDSLGKGFLNIDSHWIKDKFYN
jgi:hypothetical protein